MRLPDMEHISRPWRIHELTRDFRVEDVWALPVAGGRDAFPRLVAQLAVLVKPDGRLGAGYMTAIKPFRNLIVYPRMMRDMGRRWRDGGERRAAAQQTVAASGGYEPPGGPAGHARRIALPPDARALSTLSRIDYEDAFFVSTGPGPDHTGEQWARAALEGAPLKVRARLLRGWCMLGLRLGSPWSHGRVLGWGIRRQTPDFVLLAARSRIGMPAELLFKRERNGLLFATFVQQRTSLARVIWARVVPAHQRVVSSLLTHAARRADRGSWPGAGRDGRRRLAG